MYARKNDLKFKRLNADMKQCELAKELNMSISKLSLIENGFYNVDERTLSRINEILDKRITEENRKGEKQKWQLQQKKIK